MEIGGTTGSVSSDGVSASNADNGIANAFVGGSKLLRSPVLNQTATSSQQAGAPGEKDLTVSEMSTDVTFQVIGKTGMLEVRKRINELYDFIKDKNNVHTKIKQMVNGIKTSMLAAEREHSALKTTNNTLRVRAECAEKAPKVAVEETRRTEQSVTPKVPRPKRDRESPGEEEMAKKQKQVDGEITRTGDGSGWSTVKGGKKKNEKKQSGEAQIPKLRRERNKGDALVVEVKEGLTYADLLRKVRTDPELKELGENVVKTRRTQNGEMLFELKKDPTVKSSVFKSLVEKALGSESKVRALSPETAIECKNLDEITTEEELKHALEDLLDDMKEVPMSIRMRKAYGATQTASIRLSTPAANKLLVAGKVKVGWSVCSLKLVPRVPQQMMRCFRCMGFGHQASSCDGPDRSSLCRKCGEGGHLARDCRSKPKCMLCKKGEDNSHSTGSYNCPVYQQAASGTK